MSLWKKLFGGRGASAAPETTPSPSQALDRGDGLNIRKDLSRLNKVSPGLGDQISRYVCDGDNDAALLTLKANAKEAGKTLLDHTGYNYRPWTAGRHDFLLMARNWDPQVLRRYGEVLSIAAEGRSWMHLPGSARSPDWFRALLHHYGQARQVFEKGSEAERRRLSLPASAEKPWPVSRLVEILGEDLAPILDAAFERDGGWRDRYYGAQGSPEGMTGFDDHVRQDPTARAKEVRTLTAKGRAYALKAFAGLKLVEGAVLDLAIDSAGDSAKSVREAAVLALRQVEGPDLAARIVSEWPKLKQAQKLGLARVILSGSAADGRRILKELAATEKNATVSADLLRLSGQGDPVVAAATDADGPEGFTGLDGGWIAAPPVATLPEDVAVSPCLRAAIQQFVKIWHDDIEAQERERKKLPNAPLHRSYTPPKPDTQRIVAILDGRKPEGNERHFVLGGLFGHAWGASKERKAQQAVLLAHPDLTIWHLARAFVGMAHNDDAAASTILYPSPAARVMRQHLSNGGDLRLFADLLTRLEVPATAMARFILTPSWQSLDYDALEGVEVWPEALRHLPLIDTALGLKTTGNQDQFSELRAMGLLARFPATPARYADALLDRALGDRKQVRQPARDLLTKAPDLDGLIIPLLAHPKSETRSGAAQWLADRDHAGALQALLAAARGEKLPAPKAAMIAAISRLGGDISEFVSAKALLSEATAGLKKTPGKGLEWFPFDALPAVRGLDGKPLDPSVVKWWIVLAVKIKEPRGNPWFDLLLDQLQPADATKLSAAILSAWISRDTAAPSEEEANAYAAQHVDQQVKSMRRWYPEYTREKAFSELRNAKLRQYYGSANDFKGMLALATRAPGVDAAAQVRAYFRDHYPRTAQCRALLECLAGNPSPAATQYVLTISKRWRTRTVQEGAVALIADIAERRGWTPDELADRTIPTGGFDDGGVLSLPIGERTYTGRLDEGGAIVLFNPEGKSVQGLPSSVSPDAAEALKEAKSALSSARKEVKQVFDLQSRRLQEALCVARVWPAAEWDEHLLRHPLMGRLLQRLVWQGLNEAGQVVAEFRPMEDLTLTDATDRAVVPASFASIRLAHSINTTPQAREAWLAHFKDYEVAALFDQLARPELAVTGTAAQATEIEDRRGWMIENFKLRGAATRLGYSRGPSEDGGWFYTYEKTFDSLGLVAVIEFTGSPVPEENHLGALRTLSFARRRRAAYSAAGQVALASIPPILLSETWNDLYAIAATGAGFDPEWEKKAQW